VSVRAMPGRCGHTRRLATLSDTRPVCHQAPVALVSAVSAGGTFTGTSTSSAAPGPLQADAGLGQAWANAEAPSPGEGSLARAVLVCCVLAFLLAWCRHRAGSRAWLVCQWRAWG
jgi:hypothetical protein